MVRETDRFSLICIALICKLLRCIPPCHYRHVGGQDNNKLSIIEFLDCVGMWAARWQQHGWRRRWRAEPVMLGCLRRCLWASGDFSPLRSISRLVDDRWRIDGRAESAGSRRCCCGCISGCERRGCICPPLAWRACRGASTTYLAAVTAQRYRSMYRLRIMMSGSL